DDDGLKVAIQSQPSKQRTEAFVPVGDERQSDIEGGQRVQGRQNVVINPPRVRLGKAFVNRREKCSAQWWLAESHEHLVHEPGPVLPRVLKISPGAPGGGEISVERLR